MSVSCVRKIGKKSRPVHAGILLADHGLCLGHLLKTKAIKITVYPKLKKQCPDIFDYLPFLPQPPDFFIYWTTAYKV
jgi:hypothetical protein